MGILKRSFSSSDTFFVGILFPSDSFIVCFPWKGAVDREFKIETCRTKSAVLPIVFLCGEKNNRKKEGNTALSGAEIPVNRGDEGNALYDAEGEHCFFHYPSSAQPM
jgi:hypothetical protein